MTGRLRIDRTDRARRWCAPAVAAAAAAVLALLALLASTSPVAGADALPPSADADATPGSSRATAGSSASGAGTAVGSSTHGAPAVEPTAFASLDLFDGSRFTPARGGVPGHAGRSLPTAVWYPTTPGPWPLVVFAHGFNVTPATYDALLGSIASAGYVVAAPYLPGERSDVPGTPTQGDIPNEPGDLSFVISSVVAATGDPSSFLFGRVDSSRIGAAGHSDGGIVAAALATNSATVDFRVRATAVLSGGFWPIPGGVWGGAQAGSVLVMHGDADPIASFSTDVQLWSTARAPKAFVDIVRGGHLPPYVDGGLQPDLVRASINDFFDSQLRGDPAGTSRLFSDGNQPGLTSLTTDGIQANPFGFFDDATASGNQAVHVVGWAIDPDSDDPDPVNVFVDGRAVSTLGASASRPDVAAAYPSFSTHHGIDWHVPVDPGPHVVCVTATNVGFGDADAFLGCRSVTVFPEVVGGQSVANADGRLEVFSVRADHALAHTWQVAPGASWGSWEGLGGVPLAGRAQVATNGDGRLEVFAVGTDGQLWHVWQVCAGCGWSGWFPLGGHWQVDHFTVAANGDGRLELFAVGTDGSLQHEWQPAPASGWSGWITMGPPWTVGPSATVAGVAAGRQADGRLVLTTVDPAGRLLVDVQAGPGVGWAAWRSLANGGLAGAPALGVNEDRRLEVFVVAANHQLWHSYLDGNGTWTAAAALGGSFDPAANLAVADNQDQRLEVFGSAPSSHAITHTWQSQPNSPFGGFFPFGASGTGLATASNPDGRIELFAMTLPVTHAWQVGPNAGWSGFFPL